MSETKVYEGPFVLQEETQIGLGRDEDVPLTD